LAYRLLLSQWQQWLPLGHNRCLCHHSIMKTEKLISIAIDSNGLSLEPDLAGLQLVRVPVGTFAGTVERLFLTKNGDTQGFDTGTQGGGQN